MSELVESTDLEIQFELLNRAIWRQQKNIARFERELAGLKARQDARFAEYVRLRDKMRDESAAAALAGIADRAATQSAIQNPKSKIP